MTSPRPRSVARKNTQRQIPIADAKLSVLHNIGQGLKVADAMAAVGRTEETYRSWRKDDPEFRLAVAGLRTARAEAAETGRLPVPDFPEFCELLGQPLNPHQLAMWDVLEGREPRWLHPAFRFDRGTEWELRTGQHSAGRVIINLPPGFAKTTTISINYSTWLIHKYPDIRIIVVSKDQGLAKQILGAVKFRLTSPVYREIHAKFAPDGGWKDPDSSWTQTEIYVQGRGNGEKDPTMQALGIGGRIYGARSDVIILDDAITLANVNEYDKQSNWLDQEVESRLDGGGLLALLGTRVAPVDLYKHQREVKDIDDEPVYTYFSMPALLEEPEDGDVEGWVTLWPERFPGRRLRKVRRDPARWALVYQQRDVAENATFNSKAVNAAVNRRRFPGPMSGENGGMGHRPGGMGDLYRVCTVDPAAAGNTAMIVGGIDRYTGKRWVMDGFDHRNTSATLLKQTIKQFVDRYQLNEVVVEANAFQRYLTQDADLVGFLRARGCRMTPHYTGTNKVDPDFGVMAMAPLFDSCGRPRDDNPNGPWKQTLDTALIELPDTKQNSWVGSLIDQLVVWEPSGMHQKQKTDLVMALWFFDLAARRILGIDRDRKSHADNPFLSRRRAQTRGVVNLAELREQLRAEREAG